MAGRHAGRQAGNGLRGLIYELKVIRGYLALLHVLIVKSADEGRHARKVKPNFG